MLQKDIRLKIWGNQTRARILEVIIEHKGDSGTERSLWLTFDLKEGQKFTSGLDFGNGEYQKNKLIEIVYLPSNPHIADLADSNNGKNAIGLIIIGFLLILLYQVNPVFWFL